ncbi:MAG: hypothetical protein SF162_14425 [bacterium]|nr:hypothetical protein [bacterium]
MDFGTFLFLCVLVNAVLFFVQRSEPKRRFISFLFALIPLELIRRYVWFRDVHTEAAIAFGLALVINFLFWALIGRYNPVGSSDRIKVYGMDD